MTKAIGLIFLYIDKMLFVGPIYRQKRTVHRIRCRSSKMRQYSVARANKKQIGCVLLKVI